MGLTVAEPQTFVDDESSKAAVEAGIAAGAGVSASAVNAVLTVGGRRLAARGRVLQDAMVSVEATIEVEDAAAAATLQTTVAALAPSTMASSLNAALTEAGVTSGVTVATMTATAAMLTPAPSDDADDFQSLRRGDSSSGAYRVGPGVASRGRPHNLDLQFVIVAVAATLL